MNVVINELSLKLYCKRKYNRVFFFNEKIESPLPRHICVLNILTKNIAKKVKKKKRYRLAMNMKPVPTICDPKKVINKISYINKVTSPICIPRATPRRRLYKEDQYESFTSRD